MRFSCESCGAQYMVSDEKIGPSGVRVRCKRCGTLIPVRRAAPPSDGPGLALVQRESEADPGLQSVLAGAAIDAGGAAAIPRAAAAPGQTPAASPQSAPADGVAAAEWYVAIDDRQVGPLTPAALKARWDAAEIGPDTLAWCAGLDEWRPISTLADLASQLRTAPTAVSEASHEASPSGATAIGAPAADHPTNGVANGKVNGLNGHHGTWQPNAASALAALATAEMSGLDHEPASDAAHSPAATGPALLDETAIPEGGVDPTHLVPLRMKGVELTAERPVRATRAPVDLDRTEIRQLRKSAKRSGVLTGSLVGCAAAVGVGIVAWMLWPQQRSEAPRAAVARTAPPQGTGPVGAASAPAPQVPPSVAATQQPGPAAAAPAAAPTPPAPAASAAGSASAAVAALPPPAANEPPRPQAAPAPAPEHRVPPRHVAQVGPPARAQKTTRAERNVVPAQPQRAALAAAPVAEPAPARAPAPPPAVAAAETPRKKSGDPLLDGAAGDDELERELSSTRPKRSVYVPPAIGTDLPESVSVSQINEAVVAQKAGLLRCIEQQKAADPNTRGTLRLRWLISGDGSVQDARVLGDEFAKQPIGPCIAGVVKAIRFPRSRTTGQEVVFPFKF